MIHPRTQLAILHDLCIAVFAWILAYLLRFNLEPPAHFLTEMWQTLVWVVPLQGLAFWHFGLYQGIWRYASLNDFRRILLAVLLSASAIPLLFWMLRSNVVIPRSVLLLDPLLLLLLMGGNRLLYRMWKERQFSGSMGLSSEPVLILGAGDAAVSLSRELQRSRLWHPMGMLDDNPDKIGRSLDGIKVLGTLDSLSAWAERASVRQAIIAMPSATHQQRKRVIDLCQKAGVKVLTVPSFDDLLSGRVSVSQLREVELDDLLGRDPIQLDDDGLHRLLTGQVVMVTGAGGSIGSELCRQIARFRPSSLLLYDQGEFALYTIEQELRVSQPELRCEYLIGDVRDSARLDEVMSHWQPAVVFHAAAYKHVPLMEQRNAWQAIQNNVLGTWRVAQAAQRYGVSKFVLISTDKAVNPTNVMGASKRLAEMVCQSLQQPIGTRFVIVRFGNVLGSNGSVIPKFREQIAKGGPITVTHPDITRFFMSIPEAAQLVLQAGLMGQGGEIFVLDMGEPVKIVDLAKELIRLSGMGEDDIKIEFTGLRPGEKLYEELLADNEHTLPTPHAKLRIAQARAADVDLQAALLSWAEAPQQSDAAVKQVLTRWVPEYSPDLRSH
ncbi:UDP-N-acetyl-alpha-D-glucosamine C6 dehydratase [Ferriphaselus amnicola]|uniref:UDP-N-acetyl-alpha-D-glucosamine C6 dehydratase n=1 Tax=Ferriphaselus amnicola TaxID=1188319 RepID=A0A2Z6G8B3_9PROT|nr:nucleoside-diphosphate sugar epimerase/dehydratase [Ferriphaselus amnicola]BBE49702.1 UDP-N-acetyl-alpha-D-glucosamine C6 dehydratase [Ferriphaselus amnicola]